MVAVISFVCSVGNIPLAAVLWNGGISFGGVIAFIFADLILLAILDIYRRYYGLRMMGFLLVTFYASMAAAALIIEAIFGLLHLVPEQRQAQVTQAAISWNCTTWLSIAYLAGLYHLMRNGAPNARGHLWFADLPRRPDQPPRWHWFDSMNVETSARSMPA